MEHLAGKGIWNSAQLTRWMFQACGGASGSAGWASLWHSWSPAQTRLNAAPLRWTRSHSRRRGTDFAEHMGAWRDSKRQAVGGALLTCGKQLVLPLSLFVADNRRDQNREAGWGRERKEKVVLKGWAGREEKKATAYFCSHSYHEYAFHPDLSLTLESKDFWLGRWNKSNFF